MDNLLSISQVATVIGRSTKSLRNYIKEGRLKAEKVPSPRGLEYRFAFDDVASFARKHLHVTVEANVPIFKSSSKTAGRPVGAATGLVELTKLISQLEKEKTDLLKELGEIKVQAGYKIGQLESQVKLLETAKTERDTLHTKCSDLERQHSSLSDEIEELQKVKLFYDSKRWWHIWRGKYKPHESAKTTA